MDLFKKGLKKDPEFTKKFKEAQENIKINNLIEERAKSSNQRELERFEREEHEKAIKIRLDQVRKVQQKRSMETNVLDGANQFKGKGNMLKNNKKLSGMKNTLGGGGMFFK